MKKTIFLTTLLVISCILSAGELTSWISLGTSTSKISGKYEKELSDWNTFDSFTGTQIGLNLIYRFENNLFWGATTKHIEKGWSENFWNEGDYDYHSQNIDIYGKFGYKIPWLELFPYVGFGASEILHNDFYATDTNIDFPIYLGFDLRINTIKTFENLMLGLEWSFGTQRIDKYIDAKYQVTSAYLGWRF